MNIVLLGPPGSGKGTQAKRLSSEFGLVHVSTGDAFRDAIASGSELGSEIKAFVESGKLVPDDLVSEVVFEKLSKMGPKTGFLLDGYPRTLDQAKALDEFSKRRGVTIDAFLAMEIDFAELVKRLSARRQCPNCKEVYNLQGRPPRLNGRCDVCSSALIQREDDRAEIVQERLHVYDLQTRPIMDHYKGRHGFYRINAGQNIDKVHNDIAARLKGNG